MDLSTPSRLPVALLFPGQGAQHVGMANGLYRREPVFAAAVDEVLAAMGDAGDAIRVDWFSDRPSIGLDDVRRSTPLLFAVDYALGRLVLSWGVRPAAMLGHSIGEIVAATLSGVFELAEIARVLAVRVEHLAAGPAGAMLAVAAGPVEVAPYLGEGVAVGAVNAPRQVVLAGPTVSMGATGRALRRDGFSCRRVPALSPFHSPAMAQVAERGKPLFESIRMRSPRVPVHSAYLGRRMTAADATNRQFWVAQPAAPVLFWPALVELLSDRDYLLVECGPGDGLITVARRHPSLYAGGSTGLALLPYRRPAEGDDLRVVAEIHRRLIGATTPAGSPSPARSGTEW
ncbi:acyltransferase domain-containing protein [Salinispora oceanensis]|uniref:acyltransferase domain-containing protein n=1 Tax=Salinispora oceanensis TaxID=1050199 RepID=UPI000370C2A1|nr:acyltransferase domain-containing protein [Salinispora oceanensis]